MISTMKDLIKIINEEIQNFDFLGNDEYQKEDENLVLLKNQDLQKQFICDSLLNKTRIKTKITAARLGGDWERGNDAENLTIEYFLEIEYKYDVSKEPLKFTVDFNGENVHIDINRTDDPGNYGEYIEPTSEAHYTGIQWGDIDVSLYTIHGDEIEFQAFKTAPRKIQDLFIREYTENFIESKTISTDGLKRDDIKTVPFC